MTPGTRPERRAARAAPFPARSRAAARMVTMSAIACSSFSFISRAPAPLHGLHRLRAPASRGAARRAAGAPRWRPRGNHETLVEQARDRPLLADAADRLGDQRRDGA